MKLYIYTIALILLTASCGKDFLDVKRDVSQVVPSSIEDYQALLDKYAVINDKASISLGLVGAAEYTLPDQVLTQWISMLPYEVNGYLWEKEVFGSLESTDWNNAYHRILYANTALEVESIRPTPSQQLAWDNVMGSAYFVRGYSYYQLAQLFAKPYNPQTAGQDMGVPLKKTRDVTEKISRSTVRELYELLISDLTQAYDLLPEEAKSIYRPNKAAAATLLTRVYLHMGDFQSAEKYAESAYISIQDRLEDYNTLDTTKNDTYPSNFGVDNPEIIYYTTINKPSSTYTGFDASKEIVELYEEGDLRRPLFFRTAADGRLEFKASFAGPFFIFAGVSVGEIYLNYAETLARSNQVEKGTQILNRLRTARFSKERYTPIALSSNDQLLEYILTERRRELYFKGLAWEDYRRLNEEGTYPITLTRQAHSTDYILAPKSPRWTWPLPDNEIEINGYPQNER